MDSKHKNEIDVQSFQWGATQGASMAHSGGGGGLGKVSFADLTVNMNISKASPKIALACCNGDHIPKIVLVGRKAGKEQQEFIKYTLTEVVVSSVEHHASLDGELAPTESVGFNYAKFEMEYKEQTATGALGSSVKMGWSVKENIKI